MSQFNYFSFLICNHSNGEVVNFYYNGIPLGVCTHGDYARATHGPQALPIGIQQLPGPCPFKTGAELKAELHRLIDTMEFGELVKDPLYESANSLRDINYPKGPHRFSTEVQQ